MDQSNHIGRKHFIALDGLRGVAALVVVILHATSPFKINPFPSAGLAVDFFFALSGFVVAFAYEHRLNSHGMSVWGFLRARLERLHPLIILGVLFGATVYGSNYVISEKGSPGLVVYAALFGLVLAPFGGLISVNPSAQPLNPPSWSLFAEYQANILYGLICRHLTNSRLGAIVFASALAEIWLITREGSVDGGVFFFDWQLACVRVIFPFFLGVGLFRLWKGGHTRVLSAPFPLLIAFIVGIFLLPKSAWSDALAVFIGFPLIIAAGTHDIKSAILTRVADWAGKLSYPLYIIHYPFVWLFSTLARKFGLAGFSLIGLVAIQVVVMIVFAIIALRFYDEPIRKMLGRRRAVQSNL